jgi:hypothetical protein
MRTEDGMSVRRRDVLRNVVYSEWSGKAMQLHGSRDFESYGRV